MGARGPIKKHASREALAGNPGKRTSKRAKKDAAAAVVTPAIAGAVDAPAWLTPAARIEWLLTQPCLKEPLRPEQLATFACYCQAVADFQWAIAVLEKGRTYEGPNGAICEHPAAKVKQKAMAQIRAFSAEFGLTPLSRARVPDPPAQPEQDALGEFLTRGPQK